MTWRNWEGNRAKTLTREFDLAHPFGEIWPPRETDALGRDVLQNTLEAVAPNYERLRSERVVIKFEGFEGRYDSDPAVHSFLSRLYELRNQVNAEEWPVASEPIHEEVAR